MGRPALVIDLAVGRSPEAVDHELGHLQARFGTLKPVERAVADGDFVSIDMSATIDGETVDDATTEGLSYEVGTGSLVEGLDEALIGLSEGESKEFTSKLVAGEHTDEDAEVSVTVKSVKERELPELDDDFAQLASEFDTVEELRESIKGQVEEQLKGQQATDIRDKVLAAALEQDPHALRTAAAEGHPAGVVGVVATRAFTTDISKGLNSTYAANLPHQFSYSLHTVRSDGSLNGIARSLRGRRRTSRGRLARAA